jgi:hypothetical protein
MKVSDGASVISSISVAPFTLSIGPPDTTADAILVTTATMRIANNFFIISSYNNMYITQNSS